MTQNALIPAVLNVCQRVLPTLHIQGGASEPFYQAPKGNRPAILFFPEKTLLEVYFTSWHITASRETCDDKLTILVTGIRPVAGHRGNKSNLSR